VQRRLRGVRARHALDDVGALNDGVGTLISVNDASTVDGTSICDGGGSGFDGIDPSIGDNNASASDIMASIPVDAGASSDMLLQPAMRAPRLTALLVRSMSEMNCLHWRLVPI
jgi:hypothetical protein